MFANVDDLHDFIEGVRRLLAPDGVFVFETGYFPDLVRQNIIDNIYQEHLSYYSVKPLLQFFPRHGMELVAVEHEPTKGGSIRGFAQLAGRGAAPSNGNLSALIEAEHVGGFGQPEHLRVFSDGIGALRVISSRSSATSVRAAERSRATARRSA